MLRTLRRRHGRRRRFRDRVLVAMLTVALVPLVIFVLVVAADLGSVSDSTVQSADKAILDDAKQSQQRELDNSVGTIAAQMAQVTNQVHALRDQLAGAFRSATVGGSPAGVCFIAAASQCPKASTSSVIAGGAPPAPGAALRGDLAAAVAITAAVEPQMQSSLRAAPGGRAVWIADGNSGLVRVFPPIDVGLDVSEGRLLATGPINAAGSAPFSSLAQRPADTAEQPVWGGDASSPQQSAPQTRFTATYPTGAPGGIGLTAWMPVEGTGYQVGVDVDVRQVVGISASQPVSDQPQAYALLLDASGRILGGGQDAVTDFGLDATNWIGTKLGPADTDLHQALDAVLSTGRTSGSGAETIDAQLGAPHQLVGKVILTSAVPGGAHWVLASIVPRDPLLPKQSALTRGIDTGVNRIFRDAIPVGAVLCVLAFILASLLARRVVGPIKALTAAAERLGSGDIEAPVPAQGRDEVGLLAVNLERMRKEVNASRDAIMAAARELEGRVAERTVELRERNEELVALNTLAGSLTRSLDPEAILEGALTTLRAVVPVIGGTAYALEDGALVGKACWRADTAALAEEELAGAARDALDTHDVTQRAGSSGPIIGLPLQTRDGPLGAIALVARPGWHLASRSRALIRAIADQVGLALRTAALSAEGRELAVLEERTRLAREIHDTIAQQLTAIVLQLEAAEALVGRDEGRARGVVVTARHLARAALQEARQSVWNLRPASLDQTGLAGAIAMEVSRWERRTGIPTTLRAVEVPRDVVLQPQNEVALFRIVQEALTNVAKHSGAKRVEVRLEFDGEELRLCVRDDGGGFEVDDGARADAFGLLGMEERARLMGASLRISSERGRGTEVEVRLPLPEPGVSADVSGPAVATA